MALALTWLAMALLFAIVEIASPAVVAAFPALGALAAAAAAYVGLGPVWQFGIFAAVSLVGLLAARPPIKRYLDRRRGPQVSSGAAGMIGGEALLADAIELDRPGHARIRGESWPARSVDGSPLPAGRTVRVVRIEGATLVVEPIDDHGAGAGQSGS